MKRDLIDLNDLKVEEIEELFELADSIVKDPKKYSKVCDKKIMASLFFEPSTRTRLSFESAMYRLGGDVIGFAEAGSSSVAKGETVADTIRTTSIYSDIIVMRHYSEGAPRYGAIYSDKPVVNAGDGAHEHPTQTLGDLYTIYRTKEKIQNLKVGFVGDLKFGRTVHSLITALSRYENIDLYLISPEELVVPRFIKSQVIEKSGMKYTELRDLDDVIDELDIVYMTRVQQERFFNEADYIRLKDKYILTPETIKNAKEDLVIMHPLPRGSEISPEVDKDPRACYFEQAKNAMYMRMALLTTLVGEDCNE